MQTFYKEALTFLRPLHFACNVGFNTQIATWKKNNSETSRHFAEAALSLPAAQSLSDGTSLASGGF